MDAKYPELFASRSGKVGRDISVLDPCSRFGKRSSRVFNDLSRTPLSTTPSTLFTSTNEPQAVRQAQYIGKEGEIKICAPIATKSFYRTFNRFARDLYIERRTKGEKIIVAPLLFDLKGHLIGEQTLRRYSKKGGLFEFEMPSSCKDIRAALAQCLQESDCVMVYRNKPGDCLREPLIDTMPTKCQQLKKGLGECKRGMVDMRKRFRGNQPIAVSKELEGGAQEPSHQLYAGKPAFSDTVKKTSGDEPIERDWREVENEKFRKGL
ncbi:related to PET191 protein, involved in assembly of cytochrome oxidase [Phialocephala subalpina]|uniref:Related to PET191 protein, involved in assembly of cytochrome oxidase n=1 Tax=Phialocephala subalpina TaxID=576137 RepID=A0A1L7XFG4_9HELO|nr:related to PET191 protein, involved in assembly of cytochrome oxidase [Phialocephala subalpina]